MFIGVCQLGLLHLLTIQAFQFPTFVLFLRKKFVQQLLSEQDECNCFVLVFQRMLFIHNKVLIVEEKMSIFHHEEFFSSVGIIVVWKMNRFFMYIID